MCEYVKRRIVCQAKRYHKVLWGNEIVDQGKLCDRSRDRSRTQNQALYVLASFLPDICYTSIEQLFVICYSLFGPTLPTGLHRYYW